MISVIVALVLCDVFQGPRFGLRLTLNVQKYENIPHLDLNSGVKARQQFNVIPCEVLLLDMLWA